MAAGFPGIIGRSIVWEEASCQIPEGLSNPRGPNFFKVVIVHPSLRPSEI